MGRCVGFFRRYGHYALLGVACVAVIAIAWTIRVTVGSSARQHLQTSGLYRFHIKNSRIPCAENFSVGVIVVYREVRDGDEMTGRLCRRLSWMSDWVWHPSTSALALN